MHNCLWSLFNQKNMIFGLSRKYPFFCANQTIFPVHSAKNIYLNFKICVSNETLHSILVKVSKINRGIDQTNQRVWKIGKLNSFILLFSIYIFVVIININ